MNHTAHPELSVIERAEREYALLNDKDYRKNRKPFIPNKGNFDFLTSDESVAPVPVHVVEINREERRRRGLVDRNTSKQEFAAALGIGIDETRDPDSGQSVLDVSEAVRAYFGDPEDEAYRAFRHNMTRVASDLAFLKERTFIGSDLKSEYEMMRTAATRISRMSTSGRRSVSLPTTAPSEAADADVVATNESGASSLNGEEADRAAAVREAVEAQYGRAHQDLLRRYRQARRASLQSSSGQPESPAGSSCRSGGLPHV